jgi:hypothetical protein
LNVLLLIVTELNFSIRRSHSPAYVEYMFEFDIRQKDWSWLFAFFALDNTSLPVFINTSKLTLFLTCISFKLRSTFGHVICVREQPKNFGRFVFNASKKLGSCGIVAEEDAEVDAVPSIGLGSEERRRQRWFVCSFLDFLV